MNKDKFNLAFILILALLGVGCFIMEYTFGFEGWHIYGIGFISAFLTIGCFEFLMGLKYCHEKFEINLR